MYAAVVMWDANEAPDRQKDRPRMKKGKLGVLLSLLLLRSELED
jgi:hypothetical protein